MSVRRKNSKRDVGSGHARPSTHIIHKILESPPSEASVDYSSDVGETIIAIMGQGYSLTAAAGALGLSREVVYQWSDKYPDCKDAIERGKAARVFSLEVDLLNAPNAAVVRARLFALQNAAPNEWQAKPKHANIEEGPSYLSRLADSLLGTAAQVDETKRSAQH
jgi:transposase